MSGRHAAVSQLLHGWQALLFSEEIKPKHNRFSLLYTPSMLTYELMLPKAIDCSLLTGEQHTQSPFVSWLQECLTDSIPGAEAHLTAAVHPVHTAISTSLISAGALGCRRGSLIQRSS